MRQDKLSPAQWGLLERLERAGGSMWLEYTRIASDGPNVFLVVPGPFAGQEATVSSLVRRRLCLIDDTTEPPMLVATAAGSLALSEHVARRRDPKTWRRVDPRIVAQRNRRQAAIAAVMVLGAAFASMDRVWAGRAR